MPSAVQAFHAVIGDSSDALFCLSWPALCITSMLGYFEFKLRAHGKFDVPPTHMTPPSRLQKNIYLTLMAHDESSTTS
jgi:hypothetical protein